MRPGAASAAAPAARARPLRAGEGLGDRPARAAGAARRDADAPRADAHRRGPRAPAAARAARRRARRRATASPSATRSRTRRCRICSGSPTPSSTRRAATRRTRSCTRPPPRACRSSRPRRCSTRCCRSSSASTATIPGSLAEKIRDYAGGAGPGAARARRRGALHGPLGAIASWRSPAHEAARALRLARAVPAAARRRAEAEVGRGRRRRRPPRARRRAGGLADPRRAVPSRRSRIAAHPRRRAVLPAAAVADRARAAQLSARGCARAGHPRDGRVPDRPPARRLADEGDPRRPGRLARGDAPVRVAAAAAAQSAQRCARAGRGAPRRRRAHRVDADDRARDGAGSRACRGLPVLRRRRGVPRTAAGAAAGRAAGGLRRRARALQGVRHARRGVAPSRAARARRDAARHRRRARCATALAAARSRSARSRRSGRRG